MENLIEIWFLQVGEHIIDKEAAMECLQSLTDFFLITREQRINKEEINIQYKEDYFR